MSEPSLYMDLCCPLDGQILVQDGRTWRCAQGHSFDTASQGYIHLLPVQNKRSLDPGDSKEMVAARKQFLASEAYAPIAQQLVQCLADLGLPSQAVCLDAGCGEGYYLQACQHGLASQQWRWIGLDISKWAVLAAAKRTRKIRWLVGSNANLPLASHTLDMVLCMFGFPVYEEFARVLAPNAYLVLVEAGNQHLQELRQLIYPELKSKAEQRSDTPGFEMVDEQQLPYSLVLDSAQAIEQLLVMTPHLYRASAAGLERARALSRLRLTVDVRFRVFRRLAV